ncbi:hypothetical protein JJQ60_01145 [Aquimarina mytili]|uniref:Tetratricopeptide repeat protein n=2 Tax=Aquimarina mytili TaxID=874423 RepID=A0A936ZMQ6_9FLAO|nr:hypothetical protein [Aquimarina mytili]
MEMTQELSEKIEAYIQGMLSGTELADFENMILENPELNKRVNIQKELWATLKNQKSLDFRKKLITINQELKNEADTNKKSTFSTYWKIAASFLVLIGMSTFLWLNHNPEEELFAAYYAPYPIGDIKRGADTATDDFKEIVLDYKRKEYIKVIPALERYVQQKPDNEQLKLCLGNSYLNTNQLAKAETLFQNFSSESKYYSDAKWFLSLTYLKMKEEDQTTLLLKELISFDNIYKQNAAKLLQEIEE